MWRHVTGTQCYGNTFSNVTQYKKLVRPMYVTVSPECTYYSVGGSQTGGVSLTGWQLPDIAIVLLEIEPLVFRIENSSNAPYVNDGEEIAVLKQRLACRYTLHIMPDAKSYEFGDVVHRERWICIGFHQVMQKHSNSYKFPVKLNRTQPPYCSRDIADPEDLVPKNYWRPDNTGGHRIQINGIPDPGDVYPLASAGVGMGPPDNVNLISSWDGAFSTPTAIGGAGRRPKIGWHDKGYNPVGPNRVSTLHERVKSMSAPPDTLSMYRAFDPSPEFAIRNIGNGLSLMLATAIDTSVKTHIENWLMCGTSIPRELSIPANDPFLHICVANLCTAGSRLQVLQGVYPEHMLRTHSARDLVRESMYCKTDSFPTIRTCLVDTGCNKTLLRCAVEQWMSPSRSSKLRIQVAQSGTQMRGSRDGKLEMLVLTHLHPDVEHKELDSLPKRSLQASITTTDELHHELFSVDEPYNQGFNVLLKRPEYEDGLPQLYKPATNTSPEVIIPLRYV